MSSKRQRGHRVGPSEVWRPKNKFQLACRELKMQLVTCSGIFVLIFPCWTPHNSSSSLPSKIPPQFFKILPTIFRHGFPQRTPKHPFFATCPRHTPPPRTHRFTTGRPKAKYFANIQALTPSHKIPSEKHVLFLSFLRVGRAGWEIGFLSSEGGLEEDDLTGVHRDLLVGPETVWSVSTWTHVF